LTFFTQLWPFQKEGIRENLQKKICSQSKKSPKIYALPYLFFPDFSKKTQKLKKVKSILENEKRTFYKCPNNEISE
jgi:hypothetical protein